MVRKSRKAIPRGLRSKLLVYCRHECCICGKRIGRNEVHHINSDPSDNGEENLIPLCPNCHKEADDGVFNERELLKYKEAKIKKVGVKESLEKKGVPSEKFPDIFTKKLDEIVKSLEKDEYDPDLNEKIDELIMLLKGQIEKWDIPAVTFGTKELFLKLYKFSEEGKGLNNLYNIYKDLFRLAYSQRGHILGNMIGVFYSIWLKTWTSDYDIEKAEKCCDILLRLGLDFLDIDLTVAKDCLNMVDNAAEDMFEPEILSREILFGAVVEKRKDESNEMREFFETIIDYIRCDDIDSHDDKIYDYLISSIEYAERIQDDYEIDIKSFKERHLLGMIEEIKNGQVKSFVDSLKRSFYEKEKINDFNVQFRGELLEMIILAYGNFYPKIHKEILGGVAEKSDPKVLELFNRVIDDNNYLKHIFKGEEMITTIDEFIRFIERNSHFEESKVGIGFEGFIYIHFKYPLNDDEKRELESLVSKYGIPDLEFEMDKEQMSFVIDHLVYGEGKEGVKKLIQFLKELDGKVQVTKISTEVEFKFK